VYSGLLGDIDLAKVCAVPNRSEHPTRSSVIHAHIIGTSAHRR
jgi:hypothetical protein